MNLPERHISDFNKIVQLINDARKRAFIKVNEELINLYWNVGRIISEKVENANWGAGVVDELVNFIKEKNPDIKGFNRRGLYRMKQFYETYHKIENVSSLRTQLTWTHHRTILSKTASIEEKEFYIRLAIKEKYSVRELERQIESGVYERFMLSNTKVSTLMTQIRPETKDTFKDIYTLDFLNLPERHSERDLRKAIIQNLKNFILEFGRDFTFVGEEFRIQVGDKDFYIDLLFFNRDLQCLVAFDLKITEFKPDYISKIDFYLEALDREHKKKHENPSVGVILCKYKNDEIVEYSLSRSLSPTKVAEYQTKLIDKKLLQQKLHELAEIFEQNIKK
ncbi:MAG: DUF1016 domain-containing protein [Bacteroidetes bacterium]|nr:DUF1016 domain-containing protein [Bacteroidota bacterium]MBL7104687.1 DUF1016 family protein [Bacteroidales bacterium]